MVDWFDLIVESPRWRVFLAAAFIFAVLLAFSYPFVGQGTASSVVWLVDAILVALMLVTSIVVLLIQRYR